MTCALDPGCQRNPTLTRQQPAGLVCRENPHLLDQDLNDKQVLPKLPDFVRQGVKDLLHSQPDFHVLARWTILSQLVGPKVSRLLLCGTPGGPVSNLWSKMPASIVTLSARMQRWNEQQACRAGVQLPRSHLATDSLKLSPGRLGWSP